MNNKIKLAKHKRIAHKHMRIKDKIVLISYLTTVSISSILHGELGIIKICHLYAFL